MSKLASEKKPKNGEHEVNFKEGKFSSEESAIIRRAAEVYMQDKGVNASDLCARLRGSEEKEGNTRHYEFWKELYNSLPNRKKVVSNAYHAYQGY